MRISKLLVNLLTMFNLIFWIACSNYNDEIGRNIPNMDYGTIQSDISFSIEFSSENEIYAVQSGQLQKKNGEWVISVEWLPKYQDKVSDLEIKAVGTYLPDEIKNAATTINVTLLVQGKDVYEETKEEENTTAIKDDILGGWVQEGTNYAMINKIDSTILVTKFSDALNSFAKGKGATLVNPINLIPEFNQVVVGEYSENNEIPDIFAIDISEETDSEWNYLVAAKDGASMFVDIDESNGIPTNLFLRPDKNSDKGISIFFKENGLPDKMVADGHILLFDNFNGYRFDLAIIYPDNTIEYKYGIDTDVYWDNYTANTQTKSLRSDSRAILTCGMTAVVTVAAVSIPWAWLAVPFLAKQCAGDVFDGKTEDMVKTLIDAGFCAVSGGVSLSCVNYLIDMADLIFDKDGNLINEKVTQEEEAYKELKGEEPEIIILEKGSAEGITEYINGLNNGLVAEVTGIDTVAITGEFVSNKKNTIKIEIDSGVTVNWQATAVFQITGSVIDINGNGVFNVVSGQIENSTGNPNSYPTMPGTAINNGSGTLNILDGTIGSSLGIAISNTKLGTVNISGGTVSSKGGTAIEIHNGKLNISGVGIVSAEDANVNMSSRLGTAIYARDNANVSISGGTVSAVKGDVIYNSGTVNVSGGIVEKTEGAGVAIHNNSYLRNSTGNSTGKSTVPGALNVFGGTITSPKTSISITTGTIVTLSNSPTINGAIYSTAPYNFPGQPVIYYPGKLRVLDFTPGTKRYTLEFVDYADGDVAVVGGANFVDNFVFLSSRDATGTTKDWKGIKSGNDIVMQSL